MKKKQFLCTPQKTANQLNNRLWRQPNFLEFEMSEGMVATMTGTETALIIGGDITITKIQIKTF